MNRVHESDLAELAEAAAERRAMVDEVGAPAGTMRVDVNAATAFRFGLFAGLGWLTISFIFCFAVVFIFSFFGIALISLFSHAPPQQQTPAPQPPRIWYTPR